MSWWLIVVIVGSVVALYVGLALLKLL